MTSSGILQSLHSCDAPPTSPDSSWGVTGSLTSLLQSAVARPASGQNTLASGSANVHRPHVSTLPYVAVAFCRHA